MEDIESIIIELSAPIKTFRIFAIERAMKLAASARILDELRQAKRQESDAECLMLLDHAIETISDKLVQTDTVKLPAKAKVSLSDFARLPAKEQLQLIKKTSSNVFKTPKGEEALKKLLKSSAHEVVKAEIVKKCWQIWPDELKDFFEENLFSRSSTLQVACLDVLIKQSSEKLLKYFDKLVASRDPLVRAMAIRGLARKYPSAAAQFMAEAFRKGDYFCRLAALRAASIMPFNLNRNSLLEILANEHDQRLLKIAAAIILANPDREIPFRICEIIEKSNSARIDFLVNLQKNCCTMIRMAELCPDFTAYSRNLKAYPNRLKADRFIQECISTYDNTEDQATHNALIRLIREKLSQPSVKNAVDSMLKQENNHILLQKALDHSVSLPEVTPTTQQSAQKDAPVEKPVDNAENLLNQLLRIRPGSNTDSHKIIETALKGEKTGNAIIAAAFKAAITAEDGRWKEKAAGLLRSDQETLVASSLEYLATFDNDNFLLQTRKFINTRSLIVRTSLLKSLCRQNPDDAQDLLSSMLNDNDRNMKEKAVSSLIHFDFARIKNLLFDFLKKEKDKKLINSCLAFYLANPLIESVHDLTQLADGDFPSSKAAQEILQTLIQTLVDLNICSGEEIKNYIDKCNSQETEKTSAQEKQETERLAKMAKQMKWESVTQTLSVISQYYQALKFIFLGGMLLFALFFYLAGSTESEEIEITTSYNPISSQLTDYQLIVQRIGLPDGAILAMTPDRKKILVLPRPGKVFNVRPGDRLNISAMPFRQAPDDTLIVKTIQVKRM